MLGVSRQREARLSRVSRTELPAHRAELSFRSDGRRGLIYGFTDCW
jgi:hypothetical protein